MSARRRMNAAEFLATLGGLGDASFAPGTWGSLFACISLGFARARLPWYPALLLGLGGVAIWSAGITAERMRQRDPGRIVIDEVVGMGLTLLALPADSLGWIFFAFALFRWFDIWKPFPLRHLERLPRAWGILADDVGAAAYAALGLWLAARAGVQ